MSNPYPGLFGFIPNITLAFSNFVDCDSCLILKTWASVQTVLSGSEWVKRTLLH